MNAARRRRKKANHRIRHPHPSHQARQAAAAAAAVADGKRTPYAVRCPVCRGGPKTWDRSQGGKAAQQARTSEAGLA